MVSTTSRVMQKCYNGFNDQERSYNGFNDQERDASWVGDRIDCRPRIAGQARAE
jgi:hypothetical protein